MYKRSVSFIKKYILLLLSTSCPLPALLPRLRRGWAEPTPHALWLAGSCVPCFSRGRKRERESPYLFPTVLTWRAVGRSSSFQPAPLLITPPSRLCLSISECSQHKMMTLVRSLAVKCENRSLWCFQASNKDLIWKLVFSGRPTAFCFTKGGVISSAADDITSAVFLDIRRAVSRQNASPASRCWGLS